MLKHFLETAEFTKILQMTIFLNNLKSDNLQLFC